MKVAVLNHTHTHALIQAIRSRIRTAEVRFQSQDSSCEICGSTQRGIGWIFLPLVNPCASVTILGTAISRTSQNVLHPTTLVLNWGFTSGPSLGGKLDLMRYIFDCEVQNASQELAPSYVQTSSNEALVTEL